MDELVAVPDHGVTDTQLVSLFYRAIPEALRGHFFAKSKDPATTYDSLSREVVAFEAKSASVSTFWHKDLDKGKQWKGRTISGQVKTKDSLVLTLDEGSVDEVPYDQIEWGLEEDDSGVGQGKLTLLSRPEGGHKEEDEARAKGDGPQGAGFKAIRGLAVEEETAKREAGVKVPRKTVLGTGLPIGLLRKETIWKWDKDCTSSMKKLKQALIEYPVLKVVDPSLLFVVTTDASQYGIGAVSQQDDGNGYRPVEFMSARMPSEKVATSTYERELYALMQALDHWKHYLLGRHFKVYSDHETLRWLKTQAKMTPKLTRWAAEIDQYDFELKPVKGKYNVVADALSRRADYFGAIVHYLDIGKDLQQMVREAYAQDPIYSDLLKKVKEAPKTGPNYRTTEGLLFEKTNVFDRLCIPNSEEIRSLILGECHDIEGHFGWQKTLANLMRAYTWLGMKNDCVEYVRSCKVYQRNKTSTRAPLGLLRPLPIPDQPGDSVSIDFMDTHVKSRHGKSQVMVIVDRFSKYAVSVPLPSEARTDLVIQRVFDCWVSENGIPLSIVSDRDSRFTSQNWQELMGVYGSKLLTSSGRHPETNGQTEQMNKILQQVLRMYIRPDQINWDEMLPKVASAYNNSVHLATCRTPNELHKSFRPRRPFEGLNRDQIHRLSPGIREFAVQHEKELATVVENLRKAQHRMIEQANKHRRPSQFQVGDLVWVSSKEFAPEENISQKLLPTYRGPWPVLEVKGGEDGPSYTIELPAHLHTYPVFHASKLLPCQTSDQFPSRRSMAWKLLAWQATVPRRLTGSGQAGRASYSISAPYPDDDFLREDQDSRSSSSFSSSSLLSSSGGITNSQSRDLSIGGGSIFFLERQRRRGLARVILYWLSFGALTAASASALEYLLHPRLKVPPWAIGGGFAAVVSVIAILNFVKISLMSLRERGGSGAVIARDLGGTEANPDVHADLISIVRNISLRAGIPCPRIFIVPCRELNAFATGLSESRDASISVTQGLLDTLSNIELSAVLGHEIGHIINGDMRSGTHMASILLGFYGVLMLGMRMWKAASLYSSRRLGSVLGLGMDDREVDGGEGGEPLPPQERDSIDLRAIAFPLIAVGLVAYAIGTIMQRAVSRRQELSADSIGVALTDAEPLKSALLKISDGNDDRQRRPRDLQRMYQGRHVAHMFIHRDKGWISSLLPGFVSGFLSVLSTHPPTAVRLREIDKRCPFPGSPDHHAGLFQWVAAEGIGSAGVGAAPYGVVVVPVATALKLAFPARVASGCGLLLLEDQLLLVAKLLLPLKVDVVQGLLLLYQNVLLVLSLVLSELCMKQKAELLFNITLL
ncbi:hypothetical protein CBR_g17568 [Chara braunii]|uniref:Integrase catalytic domain-containing protein n=1 Tax=Chara braunii TaxID=69332 RepID=A0A388KUY2_CHABU|nr:hypothetical protein CBR_g17568 [Chara braunii]|eukprot:GBG73857.1 hypothetical protein CBR_g17568 [Chara braunii]